MCRGFLLYKFWRILPGFSWRIFLGTFPTKMRRKNPARKSVEKSGGPKIKIREKSVLPKTDPNILGAAREGAAAEIVGLVSETCQKPVGNCRDLSKIVWAVACPKKFETKSG